MDSSSASSTWQIFWYEKNLQGDIVAVYSDAGTKLISYTYDAWGNFRTYYANGGATSKATLNPFTYRGYYYDADLGLYYLNSRYYDSVVGRFISSDSTGYLGANGDLNSYNLYAYCSNNPVMYVDPSGHVIFAPIVIGALIGAAVGFVGTVVADYVDDGEVFNSSIETEYYVANTLVGGLGGGLLTAFAPAIGSFLSTGITVSLPAIVGGSVVTVTGTQILGATAATLGVVLFARTSKSGGYYGERWPGDPHKPDHVHLRGNDTDIRIGKDGNPLKGEKELNSQARKALEKLWNEFLELLNRW